MICIRKFTKEYSSVKSVGGVTVLILCTSSDNILYLYQVCQVFQRVSELQIRTRVGASVVAVVDGRTNGRKAVSLYRAMPEAGAMKCINVP